MPIVTLCTGLNKIQVVSPSFIPELDTATSIEFTGLNESSVYASVCVQGSYPDGVFTASTQYEFTTLQANTKKYQSVVVETFGTYILVKSTYTSNGYAGCAAYVRDASAPTVSNVLNHMKVMAYSGKSITMNISRYSSQKKTIIPRVDYDLYCAQDVVGGVEGPIQFSTPFIVTELHVSDISTEQVSLEVQFSKTAFLRCAIFNAYKNVHPVDEIILAGDYIDGQAPSGQVINGYTSYKVEYGGLTPDTPYHGFCAQRGLVSRLDIF